MSSVFLNGASLQVSERGADDCLHDHTQQSGHVTLTTACLLNCSLPHNCFHLSLSSISHARPPQRPLCPYFPPQTEARGMKEVLACEAHVNGASYKQTRVITVED